MKVEALSNIEQEHNGAHHLMRPIVSEPEPQWLPGWSPQWENDERLARVMAFVCNAQREHPRPDQNAHCDATARLVARALDAQKAPRRVARGVARNIIEAAFAHDLLEDTDCTYHTLAALIGTVAADIVVVCSEPEELGAPGSPPAVQAFVAQVLNGGEAARLVKLADLASNYNSIVDNGLLWDDALYWNGIVSRQMRPMADALMQAPFEMLADAGAILKHDLHCAMWRYQTVWDCRSTSQ